MIFVWVEKDNKDSQIFIIWMHMLRSAMTDLFLAAFCRLTSEKRLHVATQSR